MRGDLSVIGFAQTLPRRIAASATRYEVGEPLIQASATLTVGVSSSNVFTLAATDILVIGTDNFGGIAVSRAKPLGTGTLVAHTAQASCPIPWLGRIRGVGETKTSIDTDAEILLVIQDAVSIDYSATGASDGGELYTIKVAGTADTAAFQIVDGNAAKQTLDVIVDGRAYRTANDIAA